MILNDGITLYHGSYSIVETPDLEKCRIGKDFGKGFYVTTDFDQAKRFVRSACRKAGRYGDIPEDTKKGYVSSYIYRADQLNKYHEFSDVGREWLLYVAGNRKSDLVLVPTADWHDSDIIAGKIANDTTNEVLTNFINGAYGKPDDDFAIQTAIRLLMPGKLKDQICFKTPDALKCLEFNGYIEVPYD